MNFEFGFKKIVFSFILCFFSNVIFAQENVTTITIKNARQTNYSKDEKTGNDSIILEGDVQLTVQKGNNISEISANKIIYDRKTEMIYADGNVEITTKSSSSGGETTTASSLLLNTSTLEGVFDDGRVVQTKSDALQLPSGSTLIVFSDIFGKSESNVIAFKNSSLTFCDEPDPHWHIDASRTWLLPGGEFAFLNALLYVGPVPVLYFPAFYFPKDELIFNPVFGYSTRGGTFIQNTFYLYGRKPLDSSSSSSDESDAGKESLRAVYNFIKPSVLKEQERQGLILHNLDDDFTGDTTYYLKTMLDWYSKLGFMVGLDGNLNPNKDYVSKLAFNLRIGFGNHDKEKDKSSFMGFELPFRYGGNLDFALSKPFKISLSLPIYSDPLFYADYGERQESMDWISFLTSGNDDDDDTENSISSFTWKLSSSYSPILPNLIKPYVSSFSFSLNSSVGISSKINSSRDNSFYYPSQVTPISATMSLSGTIFEYPKKSYSKSSNPKYAFNLAKPDELKTDSQLQKEAEELEKKLKAEAEKKAAEDLLENGDVVEDTEIIQEVVIEANEKDEIEKFEVVMPQIDVSKTSSTLPSGFSYKLGYSANANFVSQINYDSSKLQDSKDFDWKNRKSSMYSMKSPIALTSNLNYGGNFFSVTNKISWEPVWQGHPYINEKENVASSINSLKLADYKAEGQNIVNNNSISFKPFYYLPAFKDTGISYNTNLRLFRRKFLSDDPENPEWENLLFDKDDKDSFTVHTLNLTLASNQLNNKLKQSLVVSATLPPQDIKYGFNLNFVFPYITTAFNFSVQDKNESETIKEFKWNPFQQSLTMSLFNSKLKISESLNYNIDEKYWDSLKLTLNWDKFSFSYVMDYTTVVDFVDEENNKGWITSDEEKFQPYSLSFSYIPSTKTFYYWKNRISVAPGLNFSVVTDLIRPTNSYLVFSPSLSFKLNEFLTLTFSSTSRNSVLYRYFQSMLGHPGRVPGETNPFIDLIDSFRFDDRSKREASGYKIKSFNLDINHELHDWKFNMKLKIEPRLITKNGRKNYDFSPYLSIGVIWNPMESMKTEIVDEYGEWQLNP